MKSSIKVNQIYLGYKDKKSLYDLAIPANFCGKLLVFSPGYMGFKDWGAWNLMQNYFIERGFAFLKFNFSHNGGTIENPIDFPDLEAFSKNSYSAEKHDLGEIIKLADGVFYSETLFYLLGHSRGGGISLLQANNPRIQGIVTLAAISSVEKRFSDEKMLEQWQKDGVRFVTNQRTKQEMPHNYSQVLDFMENKNSLSIEDACLTLKKPILILHGNKDTSVPIEEAEEIASWTNSNVHEISDADHVFGATQPWGKGFLPEKLQEVCVLIENFLEQN